MTLIAATSNYGFPIVVGDLLATSSQVDEELTIPVFSKGVNKYLSSNKSSFPVKLVQKIYIISDVIAAGFAGSEYEIKLVLEDLINLFKYKESTLAELENFVKDIDKEVFSKSSGFIIFFDKKNELMHRLFINQNEFRLLIDSHEFENAFAGGSGSESFIDILSKKRFSMPDKTNSLTQAIVRNYLPICKALASEVLFLETINDNWGGGFEMIYFDGDKLVKMNDITYLFWVGNIDLKTGIYTLMVKFFYNFKYVDDFLVLSVFNFSTDTEKESLFKYIVPPIHKDKNDFDIESIPDFKYITVDNGKICNIFTFGLSDGSVISYNRFDVSPGILGLPDDSVTPLEGYEYIFPNGIYVPSVELNFTPLENAFIYQLKANRQYIEDVMADAQKDIRANYNLPVFELKISQEKKVHSEKEKLVSEMRRLKSAGATDRAIAKALNVSRLL